MGLNIPNVPVLGSSLGKIAEDWENMRKRKAQEPLWEAQAEQAKASAIKNKMLAELYKAAFGDEDSEQNNNISQNYSLNNEEKEKLSKMNPGESFVVGQEQINKGNINPTNNNSNNNGGISDKQRKARQMMYALGLLKETPQEQQSREESTAYNKALGDSDVKQIEKWNDIITTDSQITPVLEHNQEILANPEIKNIYTNPEYFGANVAYLKRFGSPKQQELLTTLGTNAKSIFQNMGTEFKGAFREFELNLFNKAAIDEIHDTLPQLISKTNTALSLRELAKRRLSLASEIVRSSRGQISPANALIIADKQINGKKVREEIKNKFEKEQKEQEKYKNSFDEKQKGQTNKNGNEKQRNTVILIDPNGDEHIVFQDQKEAALKKYPELKEKGEINAKQL